jgi:ribonuclease PH
VKRVDGRSPEDLRPIVMVPGYMPNAEGSCLIQVGNTHVICTASVEEGVPRWLRGKGSGWVTAEYSMLPRSTTERVARDVNKGRVSGRTQEIQRLIGRSLRAVTDLEALGEWTVLVDCDVVRADGGTRTASITGGYVALALALEWMAGEGSMEREPLLDSIAAVSAGIIADTPCLDLDYGEDSTAQVDMNVVMTGAGKLVEVQGTAERGVFDRAQLDVLLDLATSGIKELTDIQRKVLAESSK